MVSIRNKKTIKTAVLYRVIQHWRSPIFERINDLPGFSIKVFHGCDFPNTKVLNYAGQKNYPSKQMSSFPLKLKTSNGHAIMPISPILFWELFKYKPDVILCEGASNLPNNIIAYIYAKLFKVKTIQWGLGEIKNRKKSFLRKKMDWLIESMERSSTACLSYSSRGKEYYQRIGVAEPRIFIAVNVIDTDAKLKMLKSIDKAAIYNNAHQNSDFNVLFVGALTSSKKVDLLINAFANFYKNTSLQTKLTIVGDGPDRKKLEKIAKQTGCHNIKFTGKVVDNVSEYFLSSDIFVLPGLGGLAISDALLHGLPVICTIGDGCEKDLLSQGAGILDENLDTEKLVKYLHKISSDKNLLSEMKTKAHITIKEHYNINTYIQNVEQCIHYAYIA